MTERRKRGFALLDPEAHKAASKKGGQHSTSRAFRDKPDLARAVVSNLSPEQRSERAKKRVSNATPEQRKAWTEKARLAAADARAKKALDGSV